jgi:hypothetical protein
VNLPTVDDIRTGAGLVRDSKDRLDATLVDQGLVREPIRARAGELAADTVICAQMLAVAYTERMAEWQREESTGDGQKIAVLNFGGPTDDTPGSRLIVLMKAFYLFLRALQDSVYAVQFEIITGSKVGNARMQQALREGNPVGDAVRERLPDYLPWFGQWRHQRNTIKDGANFGTIGPGDYLGITFNTVDEAGDLTIDFEERIITIAHVCNALLQSAQLLDMTSALAAETLTRK